MSPRKLFSVIISVVVGVVAVLGLLTIIPFGTTLIAAEIVGLAVAVAILP